MPPSLQRLDQINKPDSFDDQKSSVEIRASETASTDLEEYHAALISQIKRIIHGDASGDWHADIATVFGADASLKSLMTGVSRQTQVEDLTIKTFLIGLSPIGAAESDAVWQIKKVVETADDIQYYFADGDETFDKIWDDRNTYLYD